MTCLDANGQAITVYTDRGTLLNTVRRVVQLLAPVNQLAPGQSDRGLAAMLWPSPSPTTPGEEGGTTTTGRALQTRAPPDRCRGLAHLCCPAEAGVSHLPPDAG